MSGLTVGGGLQPQQLNFYPPYPSAYVDNSLIAQGGMALQQGMNSYNNSLSGVLQTGVGGAGVQLPGGAGGVGTTTSTAGGDNTAGGGTNISNGGCNDDLAQLEAIMQRVFQNQNMSADATRNLLLKSAGLNMNSDGGQGVGSSVGNTGPYTNASASTQQLYPTFEPSPPASGGSSPPDASSTLAQRPFLHSNGNNTGTANGGALATSSGGAGGGGAQHQQQPSPQPSPSDVVMSNQSGGFQHQQYGRSGVGGPGTALSSPGVDHVKKAEVGVVA